MAQYLISSMPAKSIRRRLLAARHVEGNNEIKGAGEVHLPEPGKGVPVVRIGEDGQGKAPPPADQG
jgi:hypothetical protein